MARSSSQRHPSVSPQIDRSALKVASDPRKLLAPLPIPAATPAASSALQCAEKRRGGARLAMHDDGSAGCSSAGPVAPYSRVTCRRPDDSLAPPLMEGRSAPLPPRRRWERHWWWPGRPSAAARRARAAVAACAAPASSGRPRFERAPPASRPSVFDLWVSGRPPAASEGVGPPRLKTKTSSKTAKISLRERHCAPLTSCGDVCRHQY